MRLKRGALLMLRFVGREIKEASRKENHKRSNEYFMTQCTARSNRK